MIEQNKVYCMDALEFLKQIPDNSVDLILTDPPYNTGMDSKETSPENHPIVRFNSDKTVKNPRLFGFFNDNLDDWDYEKLIKDIIREFIRVLKPNKPMFLFINYKNFDKIKQWLEWGGAMYKQTLVWDKVLHGLNYQNYAHQFELIIFCIKGEEYHPKRIKHKTDVIRCQRVNGNNKINHETVKPIKLFRDIIEDNSNVGDVVLDCFLGSGTTAIASKQTSRNFMGCEINQEYCKIAEGYLQQSSLFTQKKKGILDFQGGR